MFTRFTNRHLSVVEATQEMERASPVRPKRVTHRGRVIREDRLDNDPDTWRKKSGEGRQHRKIRAMKNSGY